MILNTYSSKIATEEEDRIDEKAADCPNTLIT